MLQLSIGAALGVAGTWFVYLVAKHGLPYVVNFIKTRWSSAKTDLGSLSADVASAHSKITALEQGAIAELKTGQQALQTDVAAIKTKVGL